MVERVEHGGRIGGSWLGPVAVVLIAGAVLAFGLFGGSPNNSALPVPSVPPVPAVSPSPADPSVVPEPSNPVTADTTPDSLPAASLRVDPAALQSVILPDDPVPGVFAVLGSRIFYPTMSGALETVDLLSSSPATTIATLPACHRIADLAAAAGRVIWVEAWSTDGSWTPQGCFSRKPTTQQWRVWLSDVNGPSRRLVGAGQAPIGSWSDSIEPSVEQPSVAITANAYAFDVPVMQGGNAHATSIEIHDVRTGRRLWQVVTQGALDRLQLGADRIAYLQHRTVLWTATRTHPAPVFVAATDGGFSLSGDGRYLGWDQGGKVLLADFNTQLTVVELLGPHSSGETAASPTVGTSTGGPIAFWQSTTSGGKSWLVIRPTPGLGPLAILNAPAPTEGSVQGTHLVWRAVLEMADGMTAEAIYSLDLAEVVPGAPVGPSAWVDESKGRPQG